MATQQSPQRSGPPARRTEGYVTGGVGLSAFQSNQVSDLPLPGVDYNVGLGVKRGWVAGEFGFGIGGYRLDPSSPLTDMTLVGLTADLKLQPSLSFVEPYVSVGMGGHVFNDYAVDGSAAGASLRLGAGVDLRLNKAAISAQYMRTGYGLAGQGVYAEDGTVTGATDTIGLGLKFYF